MRYELSYVDFARQKHSPDEVKSILWTMKSGMVGSLVDKGGRIVTDREVTVDGNPGAFVHAEIDNEQVIRLQWVAVGSRLYVLSVANRKASPEELAGDNDYEEIAMSFINSFRVVP